MKKIICATDYSESSVPALKYSYALSKKIDAELVILNIIEYPTIWNSDVPKPSFTDFEKGAHKAYHLLLKDFCTKHLGADFEKGNVSLELKNGDNVEDAILSFAKEVRPEVIVLGVKGMAPVKELFMGSTTKTLISKSNYPIMAVPHDAKAEKLQTLVYATTLADEDLIAIRKIVEVYSKVLDKIEVIHISDKDKESAKSEIEDFRNRLKADHGSKNIDLQVIYNKDVFETLKNYLKEDKADIIAMLERKKRAPWKNLFHKDLVKKLESSTNIPLLSFRKAAL